MTIVLSQLSWGFLFIYWFSVLSGYGDGLRAWKGGLVCLVVDASVKADVKCIHLLRSAPKDSHALPDLPHTALLFPNSDLHLASLGFLNRFNIFDCHPQTHTHQETHTHTHFIYIHLNVRCIEIEISWNVIYFIDIKQCAHESSRLLSGRQDGQQSQRQFQPGCLLVSLCLSPLMEE